MASEIIKLKPGRPKKQKPDAALMVPRDFVDFDGKSNIPSATLINARVALDKLGLVCWFNLFDGRQYILSAGKAEQMSDAKLTDLRLLIRQEFEFDPGLNHTLAAFDHLAHERARHPVREFLEQCHAQYISAIHGGMIDTMLIDFFGAPDTPFVRAVSRIVMVASCRRIFQPGAKFDYMTVLEGPEGYNKSSALMALYGSEWHTDNSILGMQARELQETIAGKWCVECAELSGMRKADVERVKNQLSKCEDSSRMAYGRFRTDSPRSSIFWGTTNDTEYLRSQTGNRRFFPIPVGRIDLEGLARERVALWGDAMAAHLAGESILLAPEHWAAAGIEQLARTLSDSWRDIIEDETLRLAHTKQPPPNDYSRDESAGIERLASSCLLRDILGIAPAHQTPETGKRVGAIMRALKWQGPKAMRIGQRLCKGYERALSDAPEPDMDAA